MFSHNQMLGTCLLVFPLSVTLSLFTSALFLPVFSLEYICNHVHTLFTVAVHTFTKFLIVNVLLGPGGTPQPGAPDAGPIKATPSMWRCSHIMRMQRDIHPTILSSLEGVVDQVSFLCNFYICAIYLKWYFIFFLY